MLLILKNDKRIFMLLVTILLVYSSYGQVKIIYGSNDSIKEHEPYHGDSASYLSPYTPFFDFIKNFSDGKYQYYESFNSKKNRPSYIRLEGEFIGGKRNGIFKYYSHIPFSKSKPKLVYSYTYKDGLLNGEYYRYNRYGNVVQKGFFVNGLRNGFFFDYKESKLIGIVYYCKGKILSSYNWKDKIETHWFK